MESNLREKIYNRKKKKPYRASFMPWADYLDRVVDKLIEDKRADNGREALKLLTVSPGLFRKWKLGQQRPLKTLAAYIGELIGEKDKALYAAGYLGNEISENDCWFLDNWDKLELELVKLFPRLSEMPLERQKELAMILRLTLRFRSV